MLKKKNKLIKKFINSRKIGLIGFGSIGKRHYKNLKKISSNIFIYDKKFSNKNELNYIYKYCDDVFVCSPLSTHEKYLNNLIKNNKNIFIEKPLILDVKKNKLKILNYSKKKLIYVGFNLRFRKIIQYIKKEIDKKKFGKIYWSNLLMSSYLPYWRNNYNYKSSYTNSKKYGGVLLDSIHELDLAEFFFGDSRLISGYLKNFNVLKIKSEEYANLNLSHKSGTITNIQLDYINKFNKRLVTICGSKNYLHADITRGKLYIQGKKKISKFFKLNRNLEYEKEILDFYKLILMKKRNPNIVSNLNTHLIAKHVKEKLKR